MRDTNGQFTEEIKIANKKKERKYSFLTPQGSSGTN